LIESSDDEREVLRIALQRRGLRIFEASEAEAGLALAREHRPDVILLDLEAESADREELQDQFSAESSAQDSSIVILGRTRRFTASPSTQVVAKPYHFGPLVHTIEQLAAKAA
jgi:two-component system cell cycle response regulator DivK